MGKAKKTTKETTTAVSVETAPAASEAGGDVAVPATASTKKNTIPVAKGVPKSGRVWKSTNNKR
jgi:hypothetical protein